MHIAVCTMVFNEAVFLPFWLSHYGRQFGPENLFVIDDGSTDASMAGPLPANVAGRRRTVLDEDDRAALLGAVHDALLDFYHLVIVTDADEFIVVDPDSAASLMEYLGANRFGCRAPIGLEVVHRTAPEAMFDPRRPLFAQRGFARLDRAYCKPVLASVPVRWRPGFHHCDVQHAVDCNLVLFHLRSIDRTLSRVRLETLNRVSWSENALRHGHGAQFRMAEAEYLALLYDTTDDAFERAPVREPSAMFLAHGRSGARPIFRLDPRWSRRIDLQLDAVPAPGPARQPGPVGAAAFRRLFEQALDRMVVARPRARNEFCPCGSGERFKRCHGA